MDGVFSLGNLIAHRDICVNVSDGSGVEQGVVDGILFTFCM